MITNFPCYTLSGMSRPGLGTRAIQDFPSFWQNLPDLGNLTLGIHIGFVLDWGSRGNYPEHGYHFGLILQRSAGIPCCHGKIQTPSQTEHSFVAEKSIRSYTSTELTSADIQTPSTILTSLKTVNSPMVNLYTLI